MTREPEIIDGQFEVALNSAKAGPERIKKPGVWLPTIMAILFALGAAQAASTNTDSPVRIIMLLALGLTWPIWRALQMAVWSAQCKVSEADADRLAERFPTRVQRPSKA